MISGAGSIGRHRRIWLAVAAAALAGVAAAVSPTPPGIADGGGRSAFAGLASAALVAFAILPLMVWRRAAQPAPSIVVALVALVLGISSFYSARYVERVCTAQYAAQPVVIGTELTTLGAAYSKANSQLSNDDLLFDAAGVADRIWTPRSIGRCRALLGGTSFLWIPFLVVCLWCFAHAAPAAILSPISWKAPGQRAATPAPMRYDVFVSYRHGGADKALATELVSALEADGYRVAIDERDFRANGSFLDEMERSVRESRFTVALISARYLESGNTLEEATICKVLDMGDRQRRLIPIVIEPVPMPVWLYGIVGIDLTNRDALVDPFDKLKATLGEPLARTPASQDRPPNR